MPRLLEERELRLEWSDLDNLTPKVKAACDKRSSGVHLSGVIKHVLVTAGLLTTDETTDEMPWRMFLGMAFEAYAVQLWPDLIWQPGEQCRDGVYGSPDGLTGDVLEEFKLTWISRLEKSEARGVRPADRKVIDHKRWMLQLAGYLWMMNLRMARLHVFYVNGDYRQSGPQYYTYLLQFTEQELERTWNNLILPNIAGATPEEH